MSNERKGGRCSLIFQHVRLQRVWGDRNAGCGGRHQGLISLRTEPNAFAGLLGLCMCVVRTDRYPKTASHSSVTKVCWVDAIVVAVLGMVADATICSLYARCNKHRQSGYISCRHSKFYVVTLIDIRKKNPQRSLDKRVRVALYT